MASIALGQQSSVYLGNLDARRDWGHARDYVEGIYRIVQQEEPDDFVLATGEAHSVREFVELAFGEIIGESNGAARASTRPGSIGAAVRLWCGSIRRIFDQPKSIS